jgi:hypothetical protein
MGTGPTFNSGGFRRDQQNNVGVYLVDPATGNPYAASGGGAVSVGAVQIQGYTGATWINLPGSSARGLLIDPVDNVPDGNVGLPSRVSTVAGYDGSNVRTLKTSAAGVAQVDVLSQPSGGATSANQATELTRLQEIRDRLPAALVSSRLDVNVGALPAGSIAAAQVQTSDMDTGAGTALTELSGIALPASGGPVVGGTATNPVRVDPTGTTQQPVGIRDDGSGAQVLSSAPGSDTGQRGVAVRVISQLGAGTGGGSAGTQYAEDAALGATPTGTLSMARRTDTLGTLTPVVDDAISQRVNSRGALWVVHDGAVTLAAGSATVGKVDQGTGGASAWKVDGSAVTQPVSAASLPLPASAAQEHVTAASPHAARLTDGAAFYKATTPADTQPISAASLPLPTGAAAAAQLPATLGQKTMANSLGVVIASDQSAVTVIGSQPAATTGTITTATSTVAAAVTNYGNATVTVSGTHAGITINFEASDDGGTTYYAVQVQRESDGVPLSSIALTANSATMYTVACPGFTHVRVRASAYTSGTGNVRISPGSMPFEPVVSIGSPVTVGAALPAGTNTLGNVGLVPQTTGGYSTFHLVSAATTNATNIKASAGQVFGWYVYNSNAAARKLVFHNSAGTPTAGAGVFFAIVLPPGSAANVFNDTGIAFGTGIAISTVTGLTDADATAVGASDLNIDIFYK